MKARDRLIDARTLVDVLRHLEPRARLLDLARANLDDNLPGFPESTPGATSADVGRPARDKQIEAELHGRALALDPTSNGVDALTMLELDRIADEPDAAKELARADRLKASAAKRTTVVEKLAIDWADNGADEALDAIVDLEDAVTQLTHHAARINTIIETWGFAKHKGTGPVADGVHCVQHLKLGIERMIYHHGTNHTLCRWCADFLTEQGRWPSLVLLQQHYDGITITSHMRTDDRPQRRIVAGRKRQPGTHRCPAPKCKTDLDATRWACRPHLDQLPFPLRSRITTLRRRATAGDTEAAAQLDTAIETARTHWKAAANEPRQQPAPNPVPADL